MKRSFVACFVVAASFTWFSCGDDASISHQCVYTSDCDSPLVCWIDRCLAECRADVDCSDGESCVKNNEGTGVCQTAAALACTESCNEGLACVDSTCRNSCATDTCLSGYRCVEGSGTLYCVEADPCSDGDVCIEGYTCEGDACYVACENDDDCVGSDECSSAGACMPPIASEMDASVPDATSSDGGHLRDGEWFIDGPVPPDGFVQFNATVIELTDLSGGTWTESTDGFGLQEWRHECGECDVPMEWLTGTITPTEDTIRIEVPFILPGGAEAPKLAVAFSHATATLGQDGEPQTPGIRTDFTITGLSNAEFDTWVGVGGSSGASSTTLESGSAGRVVFETCISEGGERHLRMGWVNTGLSMPSDVTWAYDMPSDLLAAATHTIFVGAVGHLAIVTEPVMLQTPEGLCVD